MLWPYCFRNKAFHTLAFFLQSISVAVSALETFLSFRGRAAGQVVISWTHCLRLRVVDLLTKVSLLYARTISLEVQVCLLASIRSAVTGVLSSCDAAVALAVAAAWLRFLTDPISAERGKARTGSGLLTSSLATGSSGMLLVLAIRPRSGIVGVVIVLFVLTKQMLRDQHLDNCLHRYSTHDDPTAVQ